MSINASLMQAFLNDTTVFSENESTKIPTDTILGGTAMGVSGLTFLGLVSYVLYRNCKSTKNSEINEDALFNDDPTLTAAVATVTETVNKVEKQGLFSFVTSFFTRKSTEKTQKTQKNKKDLENQNESVSSNQINLSELKPIPGFITIKD